MFAFYLRLDSECQHLFGKGLLTRFIVYLICLLTSLHVVTLFPWDIVGGVWNLVVSVPDRSPL